jgi:alkylation response protein AidB-like acyl-CoA dehydrogenase
MFDAGEDAAEAANIAKFAGSEAGICALDQAIQVHNGNGLTHEYGLADLWFVARLTRSAPVSREMVLNYVAQHSLRLPKSYPESRCPLQQNNLEATRRSRSCATYTLR